MSLVINELSLVSSDFGSREEGKSLMEDFIDCVTQFQRITADNKIVMVGGVSNIMLTKDYSIHNWQSDKGVDKKYKDKYRSILNRGEYIDCDTYWNREFRIKEYKEVNAVGCAIAYEEESYVVSFKNHDLWKRNQIAGKYYLLEENSLYEDAAVNNISCLEHLSGLEVERKNQAVQMITSGQDLWEKREELYPHLVFCERVKIQLYQDTERIHIQGIMNKLERLEEYFSSFDGNFDYKLLGHRARCESESVENNPDLREMRRFQTPYGDSRYFFWHISFSGKYPGRIHFLPDGENRVCIIGHIGHHLPTQKFRT